MKKKNNKLVIIRHGESLGNIENRFTGWLDVDLTKNGWLESYKVGVKLYNLKYSFDICYTSMLKRAIKTSWSILESMKSLNTRLLLNKNLNERCYGDISGLNKLESSIKYSNTKVNKWLNNYNSAPPEISNSVFSNIFKNFKKKNTKIYTESVNDLSLRVIYFWNKIKNLVSKKKILIVAHSNVIKILTNIIDKSSKNNIVKNSKPIIYEFNCNLKLVKKYNIT